MQEAFDVPLLKNADIAAGTRVLVRVDYNVPIENGEVADDTRIRVSFETIEFLKNAGAKIILGSHITAVDTLEPVSRLLQNYVPHTFVRDPESDEARQTIENLGDGEVVLLENLRQNPGEKAGDDAFADLLAGFADVYVNDAFSVSHRKHASVVGVPEKVGETYAGFRLEKEIRELTRALSPEHPFVFVLGGAKFETKLPLARKFLDIADAVVLGGALANDVYKARGLEVGESLVSEGADLSSILKSEKVIVPERVVAQKGVESRECEAGEVQEGETIADASSVWIKEFLGEKVGGAAMILWNGPLGNYEAGFSEGSVALAHLVAQSEGYSIVGGGDTLAVIDELGIDDQFGFISTGGGAMLDFLANGTLPGIEVLKN